MNDFLLDIEAKITVRPVTPKTGSTVRPPYERNMYVIRERTRKRFYGTKAAINTLAQNAATLMSRQWALHATPPPEVSIGTATINSPTSVTLTGVVNTHLQPAEVTFEWGTTMALGNTETEDFLTTSHATTPPASYTGSTVSGSITTVPETEYYWRVKVVVGSYTIWSTVKSFTTPAA